MENLTEPLPNETLGINHNGINYLSEMRKWTLFLSILGFIMMGLMFVVGIIMVFASSLWTTNAFGPLSIIPMIIVALIYFIPIYFLYQFSVHSKNAISYNDANALTRALSYLKMHFKFIGIFVIIVTVIYLIIGIFALLGASLFKSAFATPML